MLSLKETLLNRLPVANSYWLAFSGGMDSTVLLHLLVSIREQLSGPIAAVHINHQMQAESAHWERKCSQVCLDLGVDFRGIAVTVPENNNDSPESAARIARYQALENCLPANAALIMAHHERDQAETFLLQLLRGAGPKGLASMPGVRRFAKGLLVRPLLATAHLDLLKYAQKNNLVWIDDPSNELNTFDRNFLRHASLPSLRERWPSADRVIARSAGHMAEISELLADVAEADFARCQHTHADALSLAAVNKLSLPRQKNLFRFWVGLRNHLMPSQAVLGRVLNEILDSREDATPLVCWSDAEIRRYRDAIYLQRPMPSFDGGRVYHWQPEQESELELMHGVLDAQKVENPAAALAVAGKAFQVRFRQGGETLKPVNRQQTHSLKSLFQEWGIPVWLRDRWPLIYLDDRLVAVAGCCVCEGFQAEADDPGIETIWNRSV
ncbi:MAG: tRNA lysidine(34) synthetase TilS [Gammaproteobacteria bacterium]